MVLCFLREQGSALIVVLPFHFRPYEDRPMPSYYHQDCHYFYRTSLRGLSVVTVVSPLHS